MDKRQDRQISEQRMGPIRQILIWGMAVCLVLFLIFTFFSISLCQIFGFLGLILGLTLVFQDNEWRNLQFPLFRPILIFSVLCVIAILLSVDTRSSLPFLKRLLEPVVFFWLVNAIPFLAKHLKTEIIWQEQDCPLTEKTEKIASWLLVFLGVACMCAAGYQLYEGLWLKTERPYGTLNNAITIGTMLMLVSLALIALLIFGKRHRVWAIVFLIPILGGLVISQTRSAWLALVIGLTFLLFKKGWKWLMVLPALLLVLYVALPDDFKERINTIVTAKDRSARDRIELWHVGLELAKEHPVKGFGFNTMELVRENYPQYESIFVFYRHFHNQFIQFAVDAGFPTMFAWLAIWGVYFYNLKQRFQVWDRGHPSYWLLMTGSSTGLAFLVTCVFENQYYDTEFTTLLFTVLAFPYFLGLNKNLPSSHENQFLEKEVPGTSS